MDQQGWKKVENIVGQALELEGEARATFIHKQCSGNTDLRLQVTELLKIIEESETEDFQIAYDIHQDNFGTESKRAKEV